jgi:exonuclease VII large subunit
LGVLGRGYAVVRDAESGAVMRSSDAARAGQRVDVRLAQGSLTAQVTGVTPPRSPAGEVRLDG